jgi:hypothetical protein
LAGGFYLAIIIFAAIAYILVRGQIIVPGDMARTVSNLQAHEQLYRLGFASAIIVVVSNVALGLLLYELLKIVNKALARAVLAFIMVSATIEAVNLYNYISPLFTATLPEYRAGFDAAAIAALVRGSGKLFALGFGISLAFFGVYCVLTGYLIYRSTFLPRLIGGLMIAAGLVYEYHCFSLFLGVPEIPYILFVGFVAELSLALWLLVMGVNEAKWFAVAKSAREIV